MKQPHAHARGIHILEPVGRQGTRKITSGIGPTAFNGITITVRRQPSDPAGIVAEDATDKVQAVVVAEMQQGQKPQRDRKSIARKHLGLKLWRDRLLPFAQQGDQLQPRGLSLQVSQPLALDGEHGVVGFSLDPSEIDPAEEEVEPRVAVVAEDDAGVLVDGFEFGKVDVHVVVLLVVWVAETQADVPVEHKDDPKDAVAFPGGAGITRRHWALGVQPEPVRHPDGHGGQHTRRPRVGSGLEQHRQSQHDL